MVQCKTGYKFTNPLPLVCAGEGTWTSGECLGKSCRDYLRADKSLIIAMKSMNAADITTQHDNLFKD